MPRPLPFQVGLPAGQNKRATVWGRPRRCVMLSPIFRGLARNGSSPAGLSGRVWHPDRSFRSRRPGQLLLKQAAYQTEPFAPLQLSRAARVGSNDLATTRTASSRGQTVRSAVHGRSFLAYSPRNLRESQKRGPGGNPRPLPYTLLSTASPYPEQKSKIKNQFSAVS